MFKIISEVLYSSQKVEWETPQPIFDFMNKIYHFTLDVCALPENGSVKYFSQNGLQALI